MSKPKNEPDQMNDQTTKQQLEQDALLPDSLPAE
jgi:hypothetical protein